MSGEVYGVLERRDVIKMESGGIEPETSGLVDRWLNHLN